VVKFKVAPVHNGELLPALAVGALLTVTVTDDVAVQPLFTITVYDPLIAVVEFVIVGFCKVEVKLFGPVQEYVAPATVVVVRLIVFPLQTGELLPALAVGALLTVTTTLEVVKQPLTVTVTVYVPLIAVVAFVLVGFCAVEV
jgi:hypothetical protein